MILELNHLGVMVNNLDETVSFYERALGVKVVWKFEIGDSARAAYVRLGNGLIEFIEFTGTSGTEEMPGTHHLGFHTDDLEGDFDHLVAAGLTPLVEPRPSGSGVGRQAFVVDPDGVRIELLKRDISLREDEWEHPFIHEIDHLAIIVADPARTRDRYTAELGMTVLKTIEIPGADVTVEYLTVGRDVVELLPHHDSDSVLNHVALQVQNVPAALEFFESVGIATNGAPRPAASGVGLIGAITDPNGVLIEVLDRPGIRS